MVVGGCVIRTCPGDVLLLTIYIPTESPLKQIFVSAGFFHSWFARSGLQYVVRNTFQTAAQVGMLIVSGKTIVVNEIEANVGRAIPAAIALPFTNDGISAFPNTGLTGG